MGASILRQLRKDQQDLEESLSEQRATVLRLEGALVYVTKFIEQIEEQKTKEVKKDASTS